MFCSQPTKASAKRSASSAGRRETMVGRAKSGWAAGESTADAGQRYKKCKVLRPPGGNLGSAPKSWPGLADNKNAVNDFRDPIVAQEMINRAADDLSGYPYSGGRSVGGGEGHDATAAAADEEKYDEDNVEQRPAQVWRINVAGDSKSSSKNGAAADDDDENEEKI